jgi:hypothetical protein
VADHCCPRGHAPTDDLNLDGIRIIDANVAPSLRKLLGLFALNGSADQILRSLGVCGLRFWRFNLPTTTFGTTRLGLALRVVVRT